VVNIKFIDCSAFIFLPEWATGLYLCIPVCAHVASKTMMGLHRIGIFALVLPVFRIDGGFMVFQMDQGWSPDGG